MASLFRFWSTADMHIIWSLELLDDGITTMQPKSKPERRVPLLHSFISSATLRWFCICKLSTHSLIIYLESTSSGHDARDLSNPCRSVRESTGNQRLACALCFPTPTITSQCFQNRSREGYSWEKIQARKSCLTWTDSFRAQVRQGPYRQGYTEQQMKGLHCPALSSDDLVTTSSLRSWESRFASQHGSWDVEPGC